MKTSLMTRIALVTAVLCILAPMSLPIPISPVPISLTNFVIFMSLFVLEQKPATLSYIVYLLLGMAGLPVFSGYTGGLGKLAGPTGGYLLGFILLAYIAGYFAQRARKEDRILPYIIGIVLGEFVMYIIGTAWLAHQMGISFGKGLWVGVIPYLPGDAIKLVIAVLVGPKLGKRLRGLMAEK